MLKVRQAVPADMAAVLALYDGVIDLFQAQTGNLGWQRGVYPTQVDFHRAIQAGTLYLGELEGRLAAGMILTQGTDKTYGEPPWRVDAPDEKTAVIHTLGVSPAFSGRGLALQMIEGAAALAREKGWKALRLDVLEDNVPAQRLYQRAGFVYIETKQIWYESTGLANFLLYEYAV
ncbi:MAG: GNAT family N-acetyltransferase [Lawsonibacter sp.]|nr:GNAT family N-acetyltransferase [Lawsonibacter sp.]